MVTHAIRSQVAELNETMDWIGSDWPAAAAELAGHSSSQPKHFSAESIYN